MNAPVEGRLTFTPAGHKYRLDGREIPSVTQCLKVLAKDALVQWAANAAADYATDNWDDLDHRPPSERRDLISRAHRMKRDEAAAKGTQLHAWAEDLIHGRPVAIPERHSATVRRLADWWAASGFELISTEQVVWSDEDEFLGTAYAGTYDALANHPEHGTTLIDWKTGKGVYPEYAIQLAGYAAAEWMQMGRYSVEAPVPRTLAVVHVQPDGPVLHVLDRQQAGIAQARWELVRGLNTVGEPAFQQKETAA